MGRITHPAVPDNVQLTELLGKGFQQLPLHRGARQIASRDLMPQVACLQAAGGLHGLVAPFVVLEFR